MKVVSGNSDDATGRAIGEWYSKQSGIRFSTSFSGIAWLDDLNKIKAGIIFTDYNGFNIELHFWSLKHLTLDKIKFILKYVFDQLKCTRMTIKVARRDKIYLRMMGRFGFKQEGEMPRYCGVTSDYDGLIYGLLRDEVPAKWIK